MGRACKALSWPLDNALGSAHPLSSPKQCWVSEGGHTYRNHSEGLFTEWWPRATVGTQCSQMLALGRFQRTQGCRSQPFCRALEIPGSQPDMRPQSVCPSSVEF